MIYILELYYPGSKIISLDDNWSAKIRYNIAILQSVLVDAILSLSMFDTERKKAVSRLRQTDLKNDRERINEIISDIYDNRSTELSIDKVSQMAELILKREKWSKGHIPIHYENRFTFVHARSYVMTIHRFSELLSIFSKTEGIPPSIRTLPHKLDQIVPNLRSIRNSVAHFEDRIRGLSKRDKPINYKSVNHNIFDTITDSPLQIENLINNKFGITTADGHYSEIEIGISTLIMINNLFQELINAFEWEGRPSHWPS